MKQQIRDYFTFNKRERNGIFILIAIIFLLLVYLNVSANFYTSRKVDFTRFDSLITQLNKLDVVTTDSVEPSAERFVFNPNNLSDQNWKRLGLSEKQIQTIKNYEKKGGKFKSKKDFKKMYCIQADLYNSLEPYVLIVDKQVSDIKQKPICRIQSAIIELNSTDSAQLTTIKGIGPFYAKSIIKYRNQLGGYVRKEQLMEIWKFDKEKFDGIEKYVQVDVSIIKKININTCKAEELKHPYLTWNMANAIVNYRTSHGKFKTIDDIQKTDLVDEETLRKIAAYLVLE